MRWFWIDRFDEFVRGKHATAVKNVSLAEEHMHDHFPGAALMPNSLIVEGMAQTAGLLVAEAIDYNRRVVLAKVAAAEGHGFIAVPAVVAADACARYGLEEVGRAKGSRVRFFALTIDRSPGGPVKDILSSATRLGPNALPASKN